jgi:predicted cupin superfamily sugar epimerase
MDQLITVKKLVEEYELSPHPEGGYYKENYRSEEKIPLNALPNGFKDEKCFSTAIYFLLEKGNFSAFHRIKSDECWHFYAGAGLLIYILLQDGNLQIIRLGNDLLKEEQFQAIVPAGCWFASEPAVGSEFSFVGCTVAPGFDFIDFELAQKDSLSEQFPGHKDLISRLIR